jgi:HipA-like C-terminal domain./HipA-like N-terminal domain.
MINTAEIIMWGTRIAIIHLDEGKSYVSFEYDRQFAKSGIEVAPICMPLSNRVYEFPNLVGYAFRGVPGMIADSLPDRFGNSIINQWIASQGKTENAFNVIDRLCYTGSRGMGAIEYYPANGPEPGIDDQINVNEMVKFASDILNNRETVKLEMSDKTTYSQLLQLGTSAGGARAKAIIAWNEKTNEIRSGQINLGKDFDYWLMKFDGVDKNGDHGMEDKPEYTTIEYAYYKMALKAGIEMNECRLFKENGYHHFMTKRFDRVHGNKLHMQTLGAIAQIDYNTPGLCSYEQAASYMRQMGLDAKDIEQLYRRMVFNVIAVNQDDHVKNISFLMDKSGKWKLAPAYDMTFSYNVSNKWLSAHQMLINGKKSGITFEDLVASGSSMDISTKRCNGIIKEVADSVDSWMQIADEVGIREKTALGINNIIKQQSTE